MNKTIVAIVIIIIVIIGGWYVYQNQASAPATGEPIKVGVIGPLTGDAAIYGEPSANVIKIAADEINATGGINGRPIQIISEDGKCNGKDAVSAAQKLINVDKVQVILGGFCSGESLAIVPVADQAKVALLSPGSSSPDLTGVSKFFARTYPSDNAQGVVLAQALSKKGVKKVAFLQEQTDYALGVYKAFTGEFTKLGGTVTKEEFASSATDFRSQLTKIKATNPDIFFLDTQTPGSAQRVLKQLSELGWQPKMAVNEIVTDATTVSTYRKLLEGALAAPFTGTTGNPKYEVLASKYESVYGNQMPYPSYAQSEYDSMYLLADAIKAVGYDGIKIADWLHNVNNWSGVSGGITIGSDGDRIGGATLKVIKDGEVVTLTE